jgi:hypothetical protein
MGGESPVAVANLFGEFSGYILLVFSLTAGCPVRVSPIILPKFPIANSRSPIANLIFGSQRMFLRRPLFATPQEIGDTLSSRKDGRTRGKGYRRKDFRVGQGAVRWLTGCALSRLAPRII